MMPTNILVPVDFSDTSEHALDYAVALAAKLGARVHLVHAVGIPTLGLPELGLAWSSVTMESLVNERQATIDKLAEARKSACEIGQHVVRVGDARDVIVNVAKELHADLVVMGTHGRRGVARAVLGSTAEEIVRTAPCPILTVRTPHKK